jgi:hypothetical protein
MLCERCGLREATGTLNSKPKRAAGAGPVTQMQVCAVCIDELRARAVGGGESRDGGPQEPL